MALTKAQAAALAAVKVQAAASANGNRQYEAEAPMNERGVVIHFTRGDAHKNQGRFWFSVDGEDSGLSFTTRGLARKGATAYLEALDGQPTES